MQVHFLSEPVAALSSPARLTCCVVFGADVMVGMGYNLEEIQDSLAKMKYDEITATYLLLGRKASEVRRIRSTRGGGPERVSGPSASSSVTDPFKALC